MKTFISALSGTLVLLGGIIIYILYLNHAADEFVALTKEVATYADLEEWENCSKKMQDLEQTWNRKNKILRAFTDHDDLDKAEQTLFELKESVKFQNQENIARFSSVMLSFIERLTDNESPTWENILRHTPKGQSRHKML